MNLNGKKTPARMFFYIIYFLERQHWQMCCSSRLLQFFVYVQQHALKSWPKNKQQTNKKTRKKQKQTESFFILAAQLKAWHGHHKGQRYLFHEQRPQVNFMKKKNPKTHNRKKYDDNICVCHSNIHKLICHWSKERFFKIKGWLHNLSTAQCDMGKRKIVFTKLT